MRGSLRTAAALSAFLVASPVQAVPGGEGELPAEPGAVGERSLTVLRLGSDSTEEVREALVVIREDWEGYAPLIERGARGEPPIGDDFAERVAREIEGLDSRVWADREESQRLLARLLNGPAGPFVVPYLREAAETGNPEVRTRARALLGSAFIREGLDPRCRFWCLKLLADREDEASARLLDAIAAEADAWARTQIEQLRSGGPDADVMEIKLLLEEGAIDAFRSRIRAFLAQGEQERLRSVLALDVYPVTTQLLLTLRDAGDPAGIPVFRIAILHERATIRRLAVKGLRACATRSAIPLLVERLGGEESVAVADEIQATLREWLGEDALPYFEMGIPEQRERAREAWRAWLESNPDVAGSGE